MSNINILITAENAQAVAGLQQTQNAVQKLGQTAQQANVQGIQNLQKGTVGLANGFRAMQGTMILLGGQQFPQLTMGIMAAQSAMTGLRAITEATKLSMVSLGVVAATVLAGSWVLQKSFEALWGSNNKLAETQDLVYQYKHLTLIIRELGSAGKLSAEKVHSFLAALGRPDLDMAGLNKIAKELRELLLGPSERERAAHVAAQLDQLDRAHRYAKAQLEYNMGSLSIEHERQNIHYVFNEQIEKLNQLRQEGYLSDEEFSQRELDLLTQRYDKLRSIRDIEISRTQSDWRLTDAQKYNRLSGMGVPSDEQGPDPNSFRDQFRAEWVNTLNQIGTVAQNTAGLITGVLQTALTGVSNAISGLILRTTTWADALRQIGSSILNTVIQAVVKMFVAWVVGEHAKTTAAVTGAAARTTANTTEAISAGVGAAAEGAKSAAKIPYVGWVLAIAAFAAILAMVLGAAGRERGGPVLAGENYLVGERGPELFVPNQSGTILTTQDTAAIARAGASGAARGANINLHAYFDREQALNALRDDIEGIVIDTMLRNRYRL